MAVLAVLVAALAPTVSHALASKAAMSALEVCSSDGARWVQPGGDAPDASPVPGDAHAGGHCPYCSLHAKPVALPPAPVASPPTPSLAHARPLMLLPAPHAPAPWVGPPSRAPPRFS